MIRYGLMLCLAAILIAGTGSVTLGANLFVDLGAGNLAKDVSKDGTLVGGNMSGGFFLWTQPSGKVSVTGSVTNFVGVDYFTSGSNNIIVAGQTGTTVSVWNGTIAGTGTYTVLPTPAGKNVTANKLGVKADSTDYWVAGYSQTGTTTSTRRLNRYKFSSNSSTDISGPSGNTDYSSNMFDGASDTGWFGGRARNSGDGGARDPVVYSGSSYFLTGAGASGTEGEVNQMSSDGTVCVGWDNSQPVWWNSTSLARNAIPMLTGDTYGEATGVNGNGTIVAGWSRIAAGNGQKQWIWDAVNGTRELGSVLAAYGLTTTGVTFDVNGDNVVVLNANATVDAQGVYHDLTIVGQGNNGAARGYIAEVPEPATMLVFALGGLAMLRRRR